MADVLLKGCALEPLASYLKALGVLRLVAEQADPDARGAWRPEGFLLRSKLDEAGLIEFFLEKYSPTPILAPWNKESGFYPVGNKPESVRTILKTDIPRLAPYRDAITTCLRVLNRLGVGDEPPEKEFKDAVFIPLLRAELSDLALEWLDAVVVLTRDGAEYPRLLAAGGVDCRLEFTKNFLDRIAAVLLTTKSEAQVRSRAQLEASLCSAIHPVLTRSKSGQFDPMAGGGYNAGVGFDRESSSNPWDFVLQLEGAVQFAASATRRLEGSSDASLSYPFLVRASAVGLPSVLATEVDAETRPNELWAPVWERLSSVQDLARLFARARAKIGFRAASTGLDVAQAIVRLGVDQGLTGFTRYSFYKRSGENSFATSAGRIAVRRRRSIDLLAPLDPWLQQLRWKSASDTAPNSIRRAARSLEEAILDMCTGRSDGPLEVLIALGELDQALSRSRKHEISPVPPLQREWLARCDDGSHEFDLARGLASTGIRDHLGRVRWSSPWSWPEQDDGRTVWGSAALVPGLIATLRRQEIDSERPQKHTVQFAHAPVSLAALSAFIEGDTDDAKLERILRGLAIVDFRGALGRGAESTITCPIDSTYALLALAHRRFPKEGVPIPRTPGLVRRIAAGDSAGATALAARRLRGSGYAPRVARIAAPNSRALRIAAALMFPLSERALGVLADQVLLPTANNTSHSN